MSAAGIRSRRQRNGAMVHHIDLAPDALPLVRQRDLKAAWDHAREAASDAAWGTPRLFRFQGRDGATVELGLSDPDACCWAEAVDATLGLDSAQGLAVCLRLLALVDILARAAWTQAYVTIRDGTAAIDPTVLHIAATLPLTAEARFDPLVFETRVARARLAPPVPDGGAVA